MKDIEAAIKTTVNIEKMFNKSVLVTGVTGLVGSFLVKVFMTLNDEKGANIRIYALARNGQRAKELFGDRGDINYVIQDVNDPISVDGYVDFIIHAAGDGYPEAFRVRPVETMTPAVIGTINTLNLACEKKVESYIYISSGEVYGNPKSDGVPRREDEFYSAGAMSSRSCYPVAKQAAETLCVSYCSEYDVPAKVARLSHVYGANTALGDNRASTQFIKSAASGEDIVLHSEGTQVRSYTYIADAAAGILTILLNGQNGEAYNVANRESVASIAEFAKKLAEVAGVQCRFEIPNETQVKEKTPIQYAVLDSGKLEGLGFKGAFDIEEGLKVTIDNIRGNK